MNDQTDRVRKKAKAAGHQAIRLDDTRPHMIDVVIGENLAVKRIDRWIEYKTGHVARILRNVFERLEEKQGGEPRKPKYLSPEYHAYLRSPAWREKRAAVIKRANKKCEACGKFSHFPDVHHKTYERFGHELLTDLIAVCRPCHEYIEHNKNVSERSVDSPSSGSKAKGTPTAPDDGDLKGGS